MRAMSSCPLRACASFALSTVCAMSESFFAEGFFFDVVFFFETAFVVVFFLVAMHGMFAVRRGSCLASFGRSVRRGVRCSLRDASPGKNEDTYEYDF